MGVTEKKVLDERVRLIFLCNTLIMLLYGVFYLL